MGKLSHRCTDPVAPEPPGILGLQPDSLLSDERQQALLHNLCPGRTQWQQPHRRTELIGNPSVEIALNHLGLGDVQRNGVSCGSGCPISCIS